MITKINKMFSKYSFSYLLYLSESNFHAKHVHNMRTASPLAPTTIRVKLEDSISTVSNYYRNLDITCKVELSCKLMIIVYKTETETYSKNIKCIINIY